MGKCHSARRFMHTICIVLNFVGYIMSTKLSETGCGITQRKNQSKILFQILAVLILLPRVAWSEPCAPEILSVHLSCPETRFLESLPCLRPYGLKVGEGKTRAVAERNGVEQCAKDLQNGLNLSYPDWTCPVECKCGLCVRPPLRVPDVRTEDVQYNINFDTLISADGERTERAVVHCHIPWDKPVPKALASCECLEDPDLYHQLENRIQSSEPIMEGGGGLTIESTGAPGAVNFGGLY